jgi:hypothetical protein
VFQKKGVKGGRHRQRTGALNSVRFPLEFL